MRRPFWMMRPPINDPATIPKIAAALMIVFMRIASSLSHPNLILITGAVWLFPEIANPAWIKPKPIVNVKVNR